MNCRTSSFAASTPSVKSECARRQPPAQARKGRWMKFTYASLVRVRSRFVPIVCICPPPPLRQQRTRPSPSALPRLSAESRGGRAGKGRRARCLAREGARSRAVASERCVQRICREAGAIVQPNALLRDMNIGVSAVDERRIEVLASGFPCYGGAQLAVDVTLRGFLTAQGESRIGNLKGAQFLDGARADKEAKYGELTSGRRCKLVVLALSTGGRWSTEALLHQLQTGLSTCRCTLRGRRGCTER